MSHLSTFEERVQRLAKPTPRALIGLAEDLLAFALEVPLMLRTQDQETSIASPKDGPVVFPVRRAIMRAILGRMSVLLTENQQPLLWLHPYEGDGEVCVGGGRVHVVYMNHPGEVWLNLTPVMVPSTALPAKEQAWPSTPPLPVGASAT